MAIEIQAPNSIANHLDKLSIFLGGSIEMGKAIDWQTQIVKALADRDDVVLYNPRRKAWDASWKQSVNNPKFVQQVEWELDALDEADVIVIFFDPDTKAPISLLELGLHVKDRILVCCPPKFYRRGNVEIVCNRFDIPLFDKLEDMIEELKTIDY